MPPLQPPSQPAANLGHQVGQLDQNALFVRMAGVEAEFLDADLAPGLLFVAEDDGKRDVVGLGRFELGGQFGLLLICEFGLFVFFYVIMGRGLVSWWW